MNNGEQILAALLALADPLKAQNSLRYFKTAKGQYGHGDQFLGITMPQLRQTVKNFKHATLDDAVELLHSDWHEVRMCALLLLVQQFKSADAQVKQQVFECYLRHSQFINNWDLVDCSAYLIVGPYLQNKPRAVLYDLAKSDLLWDRRIAVIATLHFIRLKDFTDILALAELLINDSHDLMHKAVGWMLREVGNRDKQVELGFLTRHYQQMPRTMLRYAIEKFPEPERQAFLHNNVIIN
ncbi:DNA alkylation repair protein [Paraglaciecola hydrolytica]|uniref:DNA alkylation repair protein n=1 Tax=Paraglaciecola hydrolytica TaxID=1799789 RepID=UPI000A58E33C|nr:DNA alkylation repair protein [Paraglaciecola hydrolytica]